MSPFKKTKEGWVYDPKGKYRLPPGPAAWQTPKPQPKPQPQTKSQPEKPKDKKP